MVEVVISTSALLLMWGLAGLASLKAARTARTPQGAIGWVVFLLSAPLLALPLYLFFGQRKFSRYRATRREAERVLNALRVYSTRYTQDRDQLAVNQAPFERLAGYPVCRGNSFELLINGTDISDAIIDAIDAAEDYVLVHFYIVRDDQIGQRLKSALLRARERGVAVWFMTDAVGSHAPHQGSCAPKCFAPGTAPSMVFASAGSQTVAQLPRRRTGPAISAQSSGNKPRQ